MAATSHSSPPSASIYRAPPVRKRPRSGDNEELIRDITQRIRSLTGSGIRDLQVFIQKSEIVLEGTCWTFYCKQLAQHAVMQLVPGENISNQIEVSAP